MGNAARARQGVTGGSDCRGMDHASLHFTLDVPAAGPPVSVRLRRLGGRWAATVEGTDLVVVAVSASHALQAVLAPLGSDTAWLLLADLGLIAPSVEVAQIERAVPA